MLGLIKAICMEREKLSLFSVPNSSCLMSSNANESNSWIAPEECHPDTVLCPSASEMPLKWNLQLLRMWSYGCFSDLWGSYNERSRSKSQGKEIKPHKPQHLSRKVRECSEYKCQTDLRSVRMHILSTLSTLLRSPTLSLVVCTQNRF